MMSIQILKHPRAAANTGERVLWCRSVRHHRIVAVTPAAENRACQKMKSSISSDYRTRPHKKCQYLQVFTFVKYKSLYKFRNAAVCAVISCKIKSEIRQAFEIKTRLLNPN